MIFYDPTLLGQTIEVQFALDDDIDSFLRGFVDRNTPKADRRISDTMIGFVDKLMNRVSSPIACLIICSLKCVRNAEMAGIKGAFIGSMITLAICLLIASRSAQRQLFTSKNLPRKHVSSNLSKSLITSCRPFGRVWDFRLINFHKSLRHPAIHSACRWYRARIDDPADHNHLFTCGH